MTLFEQYDEIMTDDVITKISLSSDDMSSNEASSLKGIFYTLVAGLIKRSNTTMGVSLFHKQISRGGEGGEIATNFDAIVADPNRFRNITAKGNKLLSQVFPAFKSPLIGTVGMYADTPKPAAVTYSGLMAALLVDLLDKQIKVNGLNDGELNDYILQHHQPLLTESPAGLLDIIIPALGLQELRSIKFTSNKKPTYRQGEDEGATSTDPVPNYDDMARSKGFSSTAIFGILVIVLGLAGLAWWFFTQRPTTEEPIVQTIEESPVYVGDSLALDSDSTATDSTVAAAGAVAPAGESLNELVTYLNDSSSPAGRTIPIEGIQFVNGTMTLDPSASKVADELNKLMVENPRLQVRVVGYDETGNKSVASKRAYSLKQELLNRGVDNNRIDAGGSSTPGKTGLGLTILTK